MKFIVDAQLPLKLARYLEWRGVDVLHTDNLPNKERTSDEEIRKLSLTKNCIVITKDIDFLDSFYVKGIPPKLLLVTTGNIDNKELLQLFENHLSDILNMFKEFNFIELTNFEIIGHE